MADNLAPGMRVLVHGDPAHEPLRAVVLDVWSLKAIDVRVRFVNGSIERVPRSAIEPMPYAGPPNQPGPVRGTHGVL